MKILINSKDTNGISYLLHKQGMKNIPNINFNDFNNYEKYDVVLFFKYQLKSKDLIFARKKNNRILTVESLLYGPTAKKRNVILEMEAMMRSIVL